jgi:hypothetical protein
VIITPIGRFGRTAPHPTFTLMASPIYSTKEVKVIFGLVRMKVNAARSKLISILITGLISSLLVSKNKNSAKATVTGLKPGQKVKVTVNVKPRP